MYLVTIISWIIVAVWCTVRQSELVNVQNGQIFKLLKIRISSGLALRFLEAQNSKQKKD